MKKGGGARGLCWPGIRVVAVEMDMEIRGHEIGACSGREKRDLKPRN